MYRASNDISKLSRFTGPLKNAFCKFLYIENTIQTKPNDLNVKKTKVLCIL